MLGFVLLNYRRQAGGNEDGNCDNNADDDGEYGCDDVIHKTGYARPLQCTASSFVFFLYNGYAIVTAIVNTGSTATLLCNKCTFQLYGWLLPVGVISFFY